MKIFVDTGAFLALTDASDGLHSRAKIFYDSLTAGDRLFTSNYVVDETITRLRYTLGLSAAVSFAEAALKGRLFSVIYVDSDLEKTALALLKKYKDKKLSFTDCTSMAMASERNFDAVFAFDQDFKRTGFRMVPAMDEGAES